MEKLTIGSGLTKDTKLYRYINIESFMAFVESRNMHFSNINSWDDPWEAILSKVPVVDDSNKPITPLYSFYQDIFGQCWSLKPESDAMWRIYSPVRTGIQIQTTVEKFNLIEGAERLYVDRVIYIESIEELLGKAPLQKTPFGIALFKRAAFDHEIEVRVLTHAQALAKPEYGLSHLNLPVDVITFLEGITLDPRADDWFVDTIAKYCKRVGLRIMPKRSKLYDVEPQLKIGIVRKYVEVKKE